MAAGTAPGAPARSRLAGVDALKAVAIFAVIIIHAPVSRATPTPSCQLLIEFCCFAVPAFFSISGFFFMRSWLAAGNRVAVMARYGSRLFLPFLVWALFYAIIPPFPSGQAGGVPRAIETHLVNDVAHPAHFVVWGGVYHLWFLSSLLQGLVVLWLCLQYASLTWALVIGAIFYAWSLASGAYAPTPLGLPTGFDVKEGPFFSTLFVALGAWIARSEVRLSLPIALLLAIFGFVLCVAEIELLHARYHAPLTAYSCLAGNVPFALGILFFALVSPATELARVLAAIGAYSLGIYVIHPYLIEVAKLTPCGRWLIPHPVPFACVIFALSFGLSWIAARWRPIRPLVA